jgi:glutamate-1-semialdehyde 2,1-aminomutase
MISIHFSEKPVVDFASAASANNALFNTYFHAMLQQGIYLPPSAYETWFLSNALSYADLDRTVTATEKSFRKA